MSSGVEEHAAAPPLDSNGSILAWEDDPGPPDAPSSPIERPVPDIGQPPFPSAISGSPPSPGGAVGTPGFRHWAAADALRRAADFWGGICGEGAKWHSSVGDSLTVNLDEGEELNAYYDRRGLNFFHESIAGETVYSGESPDVVCHEFGHAILDSIRPQLWAVNSAEPPALHESYGDMSAMLSSLQLPSVRSEVIAATSGSLNRTSRLSRLAEQLGWAIRQAYPDASDPDCLRNACNSFFYADPLTLPPRAPATSLSSEPHSFSRVFTAAFLSALAGMFVVPESYDEATLEQVSRDAGRLLVEAARQTPVCVPYFSQFAAHMLAADQSEFGGRYAGALRRGFVGHGVLALGDATSGTSTRVAATTAMVASPAFEASGAELAAEAVETPAVQRIALSGEPYGLDEHLLVHAPVEPKRFNVSGAAADTGAVPESTYEIAAAGYVEDVFRRGHVAIGPEIRTSREIAAAPRHATHEVVREDGDLILVRRLFKCGWGSAGE